jgi:hypothetical protein
VPSRKDLERNYMGDEVIHFIIGLGGDAPEVRGWWLASEEHREAAWEAV